MLKPRKPKRAKVSRELGNPPLSPFLSGYTAARDYDGTRVSAVMCFRIKSGPTKPDLKNGTAACSCPVNSTHHPRCEEGEGERRIVKKN